MRNISMTYEAKKALEARLLGILQQQSGHSMPAAALMRDITNDGTPEMDAREALLSLMVSDEVRFTADRRVEMETEAVGR